MAESGEASPFEPQGRRVAESKKASLFEPQGRRVAERMKAPLSEFQEKQEAGFGKTSLYVSWGEPQKGL